MHKVKSKEKKMISIDGEKFEIGKPQMGDIIKYEEAKAKGKGSMLKYDVDLIVSIGIPKEVVLKLDTDQIQDLSSYFQGMNEKK